MSTQCTAGVLRKADAPPLLKPGIHQVTSHALKQITVDPFPSDIRRGMLFGKFLAWRDRVRSFGFSGVAWLDGSFLTSKLEPDDVDLVIWYPRLSGALSAAEQLEMKRLLDKVTCKATFDLDIYLEAPADDQKMHREAYWRGLFGYCHDGKTAKGIAEVVI